MTKETADLVQMRKFVFDLLKGTALKVILFHQVSTKYTVKLAVNTTGTYIIQLILKVLSNKVFIVFICRRGFLH